MSSGLPSPKDWPHFPLFIKANQDACQGNLKITKLRNDNDNNSDLDTSNQSCPIGEAFQFESELFKGKLLIRVKGLETSANKENCDQYFEGRKRYNQYVIQGQFKKELTARNIVWGGEYNTPLKMAPPAWLERIMSKIFKRINPGIEMHLSGPTPYVLSNLPGGVQTVRADRPGTEPDIELFDLEENNAMFGSDRFPMSAKKRKKIFNNPELSKDIVFDAETVYTFDHYDNLLDYNKYNLDIGIYKIDMTQVIGKSEPFQIMAKDTKSGNGLWSFQLFHEKLT